MHRHIPKFLENNSLFRFLFLIKKTFFTKKVRRYYSQFGEDMALECFVGNIRNGTFVDVGCFHPSKYNNTYRLYTKGWSGINIDMDQIKISAFNLARKRDKNIVMAITDDPTVSSIKMYSFGFYSLVNTLDQKTAEKMGGYIEKTVPASTLTNLLAKHNVNKIDLLSVDAEGYDVNVLKSLDFDSVDVGVILVEQHTKYLADIFNTEVYQFLNKKSFELVNWTGPTLIFQRK